MSRKIEDREAEYQAEVSEVDTKDSELKVLSAMDFFKQKADVLAFSIEDAVMALQYAAGVPGAKPNAASEYVVVSKNAAVPSWYIADLPNHHGKLTCDAKLEGGQPCGADIPYGDHMTVTIKRYSNGDIGVLTYGSRCGQSHFRLNAAKK